jgi:ketosteroid isomerase-like protein
MNAEEIQNADRERRAARDEDLHFGKVKQVNVTMLDSESVISPPVAPEALPARPAGRNFPAPHRSPQSSGGFFSGQKMLLFAGGIFVLLCASVMFALFYNRPAQPGVSSQTKTTSTGAEDFPPETQQPAETQQPDAETSKNAAPAARSEAPNGRARVQSPIVNSPAGPIEMQSAAAEKPQNAVPDENTQAELNASLGSWIDATNQRNVEQQMTYYAPKVNSFYRSRNASINAVRDEKKRVFDGVDAVAIEAGKPNIVVSADGRTATMRFRKKYSIKKGQQNRNGEVIQELKWAKSKNGWRIVSERDLKVVN